MGTERFAAYFEEREAAQSALRDLGARGLLAAAGSLLPAEPPTRGGGVSVTLATRAWKGAGLGGLGGGALGAFLSSTSAAAAFVAPSLHLVLTGPVAAAWMGGAALASVGACIGAWLGSLRSHYEIAWNSVHRGALLQCRCAGSNALRIRQLVRDHGGKAIEVD